MHLVVVPHTHWDREWFDTFRVFRERLVVMLDGLLDQLDRDPDLRHFHLDGHTELVDDYLEIRPDREPALRAMVAAGRLAVGPLFTAADELLTSGEATIRNLERGMRHAADLRGAGPPPARPYAYVPDQFGHIGQLPQLLRRAGIDRVIVGRGVPAALDRARFRWSAPDGSDVIAENLLLGYHNDVPLESIAALAHTLGRFAEAARGTGTGDVALMLAGVDFGGPRPQLVRWLPAAAERAEVSAEIGSIERYLALAGDAGATQSWTGELRAAARRPILRNVYSIRPDEKQRRAHSEHLLERYAEPLAALVPGVAWPAAVLDAAWQRVLWNAAHDSAYGAYHDLVAVDVLARCDAVDAACAEVIRSALGRLAAPADTPGVLRWNPSPFPREGVPGLGWRVVTQDAIGEPAPVDLRARRAEIELGDGLVIGFTDEDDEGDLYSFSPVPGTAPHGPESVEVTGPGTVIVRFPGCTIELRVTRTPAGDHLRIDGVIDNARPDHRLGLWVRLSAAPDGSTALVPFELVRRPLVAEGYEGEWPSAAWPARGAALAGDVAILAEGTIEYAVRDDRLGVYLLRANGVIGKDAVPSRLGWDGPTIAAPAAQRIGRTPFAIGVLPRAERDGLVAAWERFALPLAEIAAPGGGTLSVGRLIEVEDANLSAIRRVDDGVEVRVWNDRSEPRSARVAGTMLPLEPFAIRSITLRGS